MIIKKINNNYCGPMNKSSTTLVYWTLKCCKVTIRALKVYTAMHT